MILIAYLIPGLTILGILAIPSERGRYGRLVNLLTILHALFYLCLTVFLLSSYSSPMFFVREQYLLVDLLGLYEVLISSVVFLLAALYARGYVRGLLQKNEIDKGNLKLFYGAFNLLMMVIAFAFFSNNLALFWIFLELTTILSAVLIVTLNAHENILAALKYVFIASTAMLFSFIGIILIFAMTQQTLGAGTLNWSELISQADRLPTPLFTLAFMFVFIGFAAKSGIVPFHTWLPPAHAKAPSVISALLSAVLLNIGIYGILRLYSVAHHTAAAWPVSLVMIIFGVISIAVAAFSMLSRENVKKLVAFSSIEHMGLIIVGIGLGTPVVLFWVLFHTLAHALIKSLLFFSAGIMHQQYGSNKFQDMKNILKLQPVAALGLIVGSVAIIGTPMFPVFFSKLYILLELGRFSYPVLFLTLLLLLIVASSFAVFVVNTCTRRGENEGIEPYRVPWTMRAPIVALVLITLGLGLFFPQGLNSILTDIVASLGF